MAKKRKQKRATKTGSRTHRKAHKQTTAIVLRSVELSAAQQAALTVATPPQFVKQRKIRGGKVANYVEVGYVIAQLNNVVKAPNWSVEILEQGQNERKVDSKAEGEVWIRLRLTIHDHVKGYKVFKDAYGQHPIYPGVPLGDALKAAESDALKKAASMFGVALDIYWQQLDEEPKATIQKPNPDAGLTQDQMFIKACATIDECNDINILRQWRVKVDTKEYIKLYRENHRFLLERIDAKINKYTKK